MEMEKSYYVVTYKTAYMELLQERSSETEDAPPERLIISIAQGGFGQDVVDDERQVKERFLEYLFYSSGIDLPRSAEAFDRYFELEQADELIDLDEGV